MDPESMAAFQAANKRKDEFENESSNNLDAKRSKLEHVQVEDAEQVEDQKTNVEPSPGVSNDVHPPEDVEGKEAKQFGGKKEKEKKEWIRRRRGTRPDGEQSARETEENEKAPRLPKRQCALLIGFCGCGYRGMQIQPNERTIEGTLFEALVTAGAVSKDDADDPVKVSLQRAARTDAGVHAAGNVVSLKMITQVPGVPDLLSKINEELPPEIRLWSFQRVQNSFNARLSCDSRRYTYFFPSYMLIPPKPSSAFYQSFVRQSQASSSDVNIQVDPFWRDVNPEMSREEEMARKKVWRASKEKVEALRETARRFEGTHNFHNFTMGRDVKDRSCMRHIKKIEVAEPVVYGETEWVSVMLHGQSFMLHQIRKMACVLVTAVRTGTRSGVINALYGPSLVAIPKMPSLGLLLENPIFESYNKKIERANDQKKFAPDHPDYRDSISFRKHAEKMQRFKEEQIYKRMRESEERLRIFDRWQNIFDSYTGNDLLYYNSQGIIPEAAVIRQGQSRLNPFRERKQFDATGFDQVAVSLKATEEVEDESDEEKMGRKDLEEAEG